MHFLLFMQGLSADSRPNFTDGKTYQVGQIPM